jgi:hypothetical protein
LFFLELALSVARVRRASTIKSIQRAPPKVVRLEINKTLDPNQPPQPPGAGFKKNFHSFRNTFIDAAKQARVDIGMIEETVGHASSLGNRPQSMSGDYYASHYTEKIRYEELMLETDFDMDLSRLKSSKHCGNL